MTYTGFRLSLTGKM